MVGKAQRKKRNHHSIRDISRAARTRARTKDLDQIHEDLKPENVEKIKNALPDPDLPGMGKNYCIPCARHFTSVEAYEAHMHTKLHKRRLKALKEKPYTQKEAEAAVGLTTDNDAKRIANIMNANKDEMQQ
ncbi:hypothetical protein H8356DRAFT_1695878 [Neocallimastix lanati (nom. inval.)]|uniref:C2H2-type domain-containing protein n=1 Tax=Neocallimastix californiae TaxID=1754190 RepID=A0A1Y2DRY7_9FUNG|nr:hypothetical protein H8356DRAFT_1695878 [Neocallimastix sp. JGI-2020a]ORY62032.1 hypothetical protein LY90DRAFT_454011 [Neocallimastix californiae]|eukprot:ORY62032.1 hypothetical protein LY90DRAFT_454011 [Neocallimastix californiae]